MKITPKFLHIPPYLSTSWSQVRSIYLKQNDLVVSIIDGTSVTIPGLQPETIEAIFNAHAAFLETITTRPAIPERPIPMQFFQLGPPQGDSGVHAMRINLDNIESLSSAMQHNPAQANMPSLPKEVVSKIAEIAKVVAADEISNIPKAEPHCNCVHCQIARAIHSNLTNEKDEKVSETTPSEETVSDAELTFQQWEIIKTGDQVYQVTNRLDLQEKFNVFLGDPVGCTCGKPGCEHILAVLKS